MPARMADRHEPPFEPDGRPGARLWMCLRGKDRGLSHRRLHSRLGLPVRVHLSGRRLPALRPDLPHRCRLHPRRELSAKPHPRLRRAGQWARLSRGSSLSASQCGLLLRVRDEHRLRQWRLLSRAGTWKQMLGQLRSSGMPVRILLPERIGLRGHRRARRRSAPDLFAERRRLPDQRPELRINGRRLIPALDTFDHKGRQELPQTA